MQTQEATVALSGHSSPMHVPRELIVQALQVYDQGDWKTVWNENGDGNPLVPIEPESATTKQWIPPVGFDC
ncbi:hypothetical protein JNK13_11400 [bacterium]|nr:hypothetical protein [bacterium]